jgi:hypothetical protein
VLLTFTGSATARPAQGLTRVIRLVAIAPHHDDLVANQQNPPDPRSLAGSHRQPPGLQSLRAWGLIPGPLSLGLAAEHVQSV